MQDLIGRIVKETGLSADKAEKAAGTFFHLIKTQGHGPKASELLEKLPGAAQLATSHGGGLTGLLAGGMMGGPLASLTRLQALGLSSDQAKTAGAIVLAYAREKAGDPLVRAAAANIPGLSGYL
jgi:hypothetical protein